MAIAPKYKIIRQTIIPDATDPTYAYLIQAYNATSLYEYARKDFWFPVGTPNVSAALNAAIVDWTATNKVDWEAAEQQFIAFQDLLDGLDGGLIDPAALAASEGA